MTPLLLCFILASDLHTAARAGDIDTVTALIARGADVNEYDSLGGTPLLLLHGWAISAYLWRHNIAIRPSPHTINEFL